MSEDKTVTDLAKELGERAYEAGKLHGTLSERERIGTELQLLIAGRDYSTTFTLPELLALIFPTDGR